MDKIKLPYNKMDMDPNVDWDVLVKMLQGTCSEQEKLHFEHWLAENAENRKFFEELKLLWETSGSIFNDYVPDHKKSWKKIVQKINPETKGRQLFWYFSRAAAILLIILGIWWFIRPGEIKLITVENITSKALKYTLPDSSNVWIAQNASIQFDPHFKKRMVRLFGKAYFEVMHNRQKPFSVTCKNTEVDVLGTSFLVNNVDDTSKVAVDVYSGRVLFGFQSLKDTLFIGSSAYADLDKSILIRLPRIESNSLAWKTRRIVFENTSLKETCEFLANYYNVEIGIENNMVEVKTLTSSFENLTIEETLMIISETLQVHFKKTNEGYILY